VTTQTETADEARIGGLWQNADFLKLWGGQSLSLIGSQITQVALPYVAVVLLDATAGQMGLLGALVRAPLVLFPFVGVWVDRRRKREVLVVSDLGRAAILATVPLLYALDVLSIEWLYVVMLVMGVFHTIFEVAYRSYLPALVDSQDLGDGNSKLQLSDSVSKTVGPGLAGVLVGLRSAAYVIIIDVATYVASAIACVRIRTREPAPSAGGGDTRVLAEIRAGLRWVMANPYIRPMALASAVYSFFELGVLQTIYFIFLIREVEVPVGWIGFVLAVGGVGAITGAFLSVRLMRSIGPGPTMVWGTVLGNCTLLLIPLAGGPLWVAVAMLSVSQLVVNLCNQTSLVNFITLLQSVTPAEMGGKVIGTIWSLGLIPAPLGALAAGALGELIGLRPTVAITVAIGGLVPIALLLFSPLPRLRKIPGLEEAAT
jgi:Na+/melibiose symporter-like transporter